MKRGFRIALLLIGASLAGLLVSEGLYRSPSGKEIVERVGRRTLDFADSYGFGLQGNDEDWEHILLAQNLRNVSQDVTVGEAELEHELNLLRAQFGEETVFTRTMESSKLTETSLRDELTEHLRARAWIEKQIAPELLVTEAETRMFYNAQAEQFIQPPRFRASHIFLAAPDGTPPEIIAAKQSAIQGLAVRLLAGESLTQLAAEASEDEATKSQGGDLGYFSAARMPPEFVAEVEKLRVGELSSPIRLHLGFHVMQVTDAKPSRKLSYEEARPAIQLSLGNGKRAAAVARLRERMSAAQARSGDTPVATP